MRFRALERLLSKIPEYPLAVALLSVVYRLDGQWEKSQPLIAKIKKAGFFDYDMYLQNTAKNLAALGRSAEAALLLEMTGGKRFPEPHVPAVSVSRRADFLTKKTKEKIENLLQRAVAHHRNGEWEEAEGLYHRVLQNEPDASRRLTSSWSGEPAKRGNRPGRRAGPEGHLSGWPSPRFFTSASEMFFLPRGEAGRPWKASGRLCAWNRSLPEAHYNLANELLRTTGLTNPSSIIRKP